MHVRLHRFTVPVSLLVILLVSVTSSFADQVRIPAGDFAPPFGLEKGQQSARVAEFAIDRRPVTRAAYAEFVAAHPEWRHGHVPENEADTEYLQDWDGDRPRPSEEKYPVTYVSWFAATAYCRAHGGGLPTTLEWEYVGAASQTEANAEKDQAFIDSILGWYAGPRSGDSTLGPVGGPPNFYGLENMHGLVWEWTSDFSTSFVDVEGCTESDKAKNSIACDSAVADAVRRDNYPAYMRYAMRGSLKTSETLGDLGFRCAYDVPPAEPEEAK
jgi:formylglycine-generating enzyme required for sulfatase activity